MASVDVTWTPPITPSQSQPRIPCIWEAFNPTRSAALEMTASHTACIPSGPEAQDSTGRYMLHVAAGQLVRVSIK